MGSRSSICICIPTIRQKRRPGSWRSVARTFYNYLRELIDAGLGKRLMFGSDQMRWPEAIGWAVEAIKQAPFLSDEQNRDIFYNNAARFLRLEQSAD